MKKVYIVAGGEYSDYQIYGVFSTEDKAQEFRDKWADHCQIEVWPLAETPTVEGKYFTVKMGPEAGEVAHISRLSLRLTGEEEEIEEGVGWLWIPVFARDEKHAVKVANQKRISWLTGRAVGADR